MKNLLLLVAFAIMLTALGCKPDKPQLTEKEIALNRIDSLEAIIKDSLNKTSNPDIKLALHAIKNYEYYAADYPQDSMAPDFLFKAAQMYEGVLHDYPKAIKTYEKIYVNYPKYKNRPMMIFHQGNAYSELQDTASAIGHFNRFITLYPNHPFADDAQGLIQFMRMDEKGMQDFFRKAEEQQSTPRNNIQ